MAGFTQWNLAENDAFQYSGAITVLETAFGLDVATFGQGVTTNPATSSAADATKTPGSRGILLGLTTGDLVMIYQAGTVAPTGLVYRTSGDRGATWTSATQLSSSQTVFPTAAVQRDTNDIHLCYSRDETTPTLDATASVFYRKFTNIGAPAAPSFLIGTELTLMLGSGSVGFGRASLSLDENDVPFCVAVRHTATLNTVACAIGSVSGNLAGAAIDLDATNVNIFTADVSLATTASGGDWYLGVNSAGSFWLAKSPSPNAGASNITFNPLASISSDAGHEISIVGHPIASGVHMVHMAYIKNGNGSLVTWSEDTQSLNTPIILVPSAQRIQVVHDQYEPWIYYMQKVGSIYTPGYASEASGWTLSPVTTTSTETWDWPNGVKRIDDAQAIVFAWSTSGLSPNKIYLNVSNTRIAKNVTDTLLGTDFSKNTITLNDIRVILDSAGIGLVVNDLIVSAGDRDEAVRTFTPKAFDTAVAAEILQQIIHGNDTAHATEFNDIRQTAADTGLGTDVSSLKQQKAAADTGTGAEASKIGPKAFDSGSALDIITNIKKALNDLIVASDLPFTNIRVSDTITVHEVENLTLLITETAQATDVLNRILRLFDTGQAEELIHNVFNLSRWIQENFVQKNAFQTLSSFGDTFFAHDEAFINLIVNDVVQGTDLESKVVAAAATLLRLLVTNSVMKLEAK